MVKRTLRYRRRPRRYKKKRYFKRRFRKGKSNSNVLNVKLIENGSLLCYSSTASLSEGGETIFWGGTSTTLTNAYTRIQDSNEFTVNLSRWKWWRIKGVSIRYYPL